MGSAIFAAPWHPNIKLRERIDLRFEFDRLRERRLCSVEVALQRKRSGEPIRKMSNPRVCGTRLDEQVYRLIHMVQHQMGPAQ